MTDTATRHPKRESGVGAAPAGRSPMGGAHTLGEAKGSGSTAVAQMVARSAGRGYQKYLPNIQKRDGRIVPFEFDKIAEAIHEAMLASGEGSKEEAEVAAHKVA